MSLAFAAGPGGVYVDESPRVRGVATPAGRTVFLEASRPRCGTCHVLQDAGSTGRAGPNLDELQPTEEQVRVAVMSGVGRMARQTHLTREQVEAVAQYVAAVAAIPD